MPTELEIWNLYWAAGTSVGIYFAALAFLVWVSFRACNLIGETDNTLGKAIVTVFCLTIDWNLNINAAYYEWIHNGTAGVFSAIKEQGVEISSGAQTLITNSNPGLEFNMIPDIVTGLFILAIIAMQMTSIWMKK
tara:strand:+ start:330 stop:734 length:405 start_codon:yes stop_codon:yes gene_type:complete